MRTCSHDQCQVWIECMHRSHNCRCLRLIVGCCVVEGAMWLHVSQHDASSTRHRVERAQLRECPRLHFLGRERYHTPTEAVQVGVTRMRANGHMVLRGQQQRPMHEE